MALRLSDLSTQFVLFKVFIFLLPVPFFTEMTLNQDCSVKSTKDMKLRIINGTLEQMLESARDPQGKILNGLDFPGSMTAAEINSHSTDLTAWYYTRGAKGYKATKEFPWAHMRWFVVSTGNTITFVHIDADGVCSEVRVICGKKVWILGGAKKGYSLANIMAFLRSDFYVETADERLQWEAIVLTPGTHLYGSFQYLAVDLS